MGEDAARAVTRRGLLGAAGLGAASAVAMVPGRAVASEDDDLAVIARSPVNAQSPEFWDGNPSHLGAALADALDHADEIGAPKVFAPAGEYAVANLAVPSGVHLYGEGDKTVLTCAQPAYVAVSLGDAPYTPNGEGITVSDLKVLGDQSSPSGSGNAAVSVCAPGSRVERVTVEDARGDAIKVYGWAAGAKVIDCRVINSKGRAIWAVQEYTTVTEDLEGPEFRGNVIELGTGMGDRGIRISRGASPTSRWLHPRVVDNRVTTPTGSSSLCIELWGGAVVSPVVSGNQTSGGSMGISLNHSPHASVTGNVVKGWAYAGIEIAGGDTSAHPGDVGHEPGSRWMAVAGNVVDGDRGDGIFGLYGIVASINAEIDNLTGISITGNTTTQCMTGIRSGGGHDVVVSGNSVSCVDDPDAYVQLESADWSNDWGGIVIRNLAQNLVCVGNSVIGHGVAPAGIRLENPVDLTCVGNVVADCHLDRDIYLRNAHPTRAHFGDGTRGAISGNRANVVMIADSHGGAEDLRVGQSRRVPPTLAPVSQRLLIPAGPDVAEVTGSGNVTSIVGFYAGKRDKETETESIHWIDEERQYPGRDQVTLVFNSSLTVKDGGNIRLSGGDFNAQPGCVLTLVCDGESWYEVSRVGT